MTKSLALPNPANARLPEAYEHAKSAIAKAAKVDECKSWADKAEAIASYARQADDDALLHHAQRIKARAIRRCGELLREFEPKKTGRPKSKGGTSPTLSPRQKAARDAGLSDDQRKQAQRVANVPEEEFEAAVEQGAPATITELAERGTKKRKPLVDLKGRSPKDFKVATAVQGAVKALHRLVVTKPNIKAVRRGLYDRERPKLAKTARACATWLNKLAKELENA